MITVYHYPACSTCKKAIRFLEARNVDFKLVHIVDHPPSKALLSKVMKHAELPISKLFNTSGQVYREGNYKEKLKTMSTADALSELSQHGKLIKRPLVVGETKEGPVYLVGFDEAAYEAVF